ncbi:hypothetical protein ABB02_01396 [Clostridiaceae bacterium JG1575]|nr:hypothetical protein ABB02_01396 [Clostridiaceae bacterium JG1575]
MDLLIVRHGQTLANTKNWYYGVTDSPLTPRGMEQAKAAGLLINRLQFSPDLLFCSERERTVDTLSLMGFEAAFAKVDRRLNEQHMGDFECMTYEEIGRRYPKVFDEWNADYNHYAPPGGESRETLYHRVKSFFEELVAQEGDSDKKILVVSHGGVMHSAYTYFNGGSWDAYYGVYFGNCATLRARTIGGKLVVHALYNPEELQKAYGSQVR